MTEHRRSRPGALVLLLSFACYTLISTMFISVHAPKHAVIDVAKDYVKQNLEKAHDTAKMVVRRGKEAVDRLAKVPGMVAPPEVRSRYVVDSSVVGNPQALLKDPVSAVQNMKQNWDYVYSHRKLGDVHFKGGDNGGWSARYVKEGPEIGGTVGAKIDSDNSLNIQYAPDVSQLLGTPAGANAMVGYDSQGGGYGHVGTAVEGETGRLAYDFDFQNLGTSPDLTHELSGDLVLTPKTAGHANLKIPQDPNRPKNWAVSIDQDIWGNVERVGADEGLGVDGQISARNEGVTGNLRVRASPAKNLVAEYQASVHKPMFEGAGPLSLDQAGQATYKVGPDGAIYAQFQKRGGDPAMVKVGYRVSTEEEY